jgi:alpha-amylase
MSNHYYYNDYENELSINNISEKYYLPSNRILYDLIHFTKNDFKFSFLFSGIGLDLIELYNPEVIESYKSLIDTGCVELLSGTYSNSFMPHFYSGVYEDQLNLQKARIKSLFCKDTHPSNLRDLKNYQNRLTDPVIKIKFRDKTSDKFIFYSPNYRNRKGWYQKPMKLVNMINNYSRKGYNLVDIFMPHNLGYDPVSSTDILEFLEWFPIKVLSDSDFRFGLPSGQDKDSEEELLIGSQSESTTERLEILHANCNEMQIDAFQKLYSYSEQMKKCDDPLLKKDWLYLQACDYFYYMDPLLYEKSESVRTLLPYSSSFFAYMNYMNILIDFSGRLHEWFNRNAADEPDFGNKSVKTDKDRQDSVPDRRNKIRETGIK